MALFWCCYLVRNCYKCLPQKKKIHSSVFQSVNSTVKIWGKKDFGHVWDMVAVVVGTHGLLVGDGGMDRVRRWNVLQGEDARYQHARGRLTRKIRREVRRVALLWLFVQQMENATGRLHHFGVSHLQIVLFHTSISKDDAIVLLVCSGEILCRELRLQTQW